MALINYYQIQEDLQALLLTGPTLGYTTTPKNIFIEAMDREAIFDHMPFINIRLVDGEIEIRSIPTGYYAKLPYEVDIVSFDLSEFRKAATLRDILMGEAQLAVQQTPRFNGDISTSIIGPSIKFGAGTPEGAGGHIAIGTFTVQVETYVEPA